MLANLPSSCQAVLTTLARLAQVRGLSVYLVGGVLRDHLAQRVSHPLNVDVAVPRGAKPLAQALASELHGALVVLDEPLGAVRVVIGHGPDRVECDVNDFRAPTLDEDLRKRDFTVNAMALPLEAALQSSWHAALVDPLNGRHDVERGRLRAVSPTAFHDDPVRILRGFRLAAHYGWQLEEPTRALMREGVGGLSRIAGERITMELFKLLSTPHASDSLRALDVLGALSVLWPEVDPCRQTDQGPYHHLDVWEHSLETVAQLEHTLTAAFYTATLRPVFQPYLDTCLAGDRSRQALLKLIALLHDIGKPTTRTVDATGRLRFTGHEHVGATMARGIAKRLKLSSREETAIVRHITAHLRPGHLSRESAITKRAVFRFFRDTGDEGPGILLVWMADRLATKGPRVSADELPHQQAIIEQLLSAYFIAPEETVSPPRLVTGHDLMRELRLPAGPTVGELLQAIAEAQVERTVTTKDEALALAKTLLEHSAARRQL